MAEEYIEEAPSPIRLLIPIVIVRGIAYALWSYREQIGAYVAPPPTVPPPVTPVVPLPVVPPPITPPPIAPPPTPTPTPTLTPPPITIPPSPLPSGVTLPSTYTPPPGTTATPVAVVPSPPPDAKTEEQVIAETGKPIQYAKVYFSVWLLGVFPVDRAGIQLTGIDVNLAGNNYTYPSGITEDPFLQIPYGKYFYRILMPYPTYDKVATTGYVTVDEPEERVIVKV